MGGGGDKIRKKERERGSVWSNALTHSLTHPLVPSLDCLLAIIIIVAVVIIKVDRTMTKYRVRRKNIRIIDTLAGVLSRYLLVFSQQW